MRGLNNFIPCQIVEDYCVKRKLKPQITEQCDLLTPITPITNLTSLYLPLILKVLITSFWWGPARFHFINLEVSVIL